MPAKILLLHGLLDGSRQTNVDFSLALARYAHGHEVHLGNILAPMDSSMNEDVWDALVITYEIAAMRTLPIWPWVVKRISKVRERCSRFALFVQDDYTYSKAIDEVASELGATTILSPLAEFADLLYPQSLRKGVEVCHVFTGYVDTNRASYWKDKAKPLIDRTIDLGQRVTLLPPEWGEGAQQKARAAQRMAQIAADKGFSVDVNTNADATLGGNEWLEFLASCRFTVGARGGSSWIDYSGKGARDIARRNLLRRFEVCVTNTEPPRSVFVGDFRAIGPRIFEAAITGTCQVLVRDTYLPEIQPWEHYIPLEPDFSNVDEVLTVMTDLDRCWQLAGNARYALTEESTKYHYQTLAEATLNALHLEALASPEQGTAVDLVASLRPFLELPEGSRFAVRKEIAHPSARSTESSGGPGELFAKSVRASGELLVEAIAWPWAAPLP